MSNITESECCHECKVAHRKCVDWASGDPEKGVTCLHILEHCKDNCGDC